MISEALEYVRKEWKDHLGLDDAEIVTGHIHELKENGNGASGCLSLVNVEEERALKNSDPPYVRENHQLRYKEPPLYVNLYLLFVFSFDKYDTSLLRLSETVELFQSRRHFSAANARPANPFPASLEKLVFDFHNLDFEQLNHLWGVLGGAYFPAVLYKVRLVRMQRDVSAAGPEITTVEVGTSVV